jgi:hypothetical protein
LEEQDLMMLQQLEEFANLARHDRVMSFQNVDAADLREYEDRLIVVQWSRKSRIGELWSRYGSPPQLFRISKPTSSTGTEYALL